MNNKGFSLIEVVLSFSLVVIILASLIVVVINYRDKSVDEEIKSSLLDFKNTITKIVYDDIVNGRYKKLGRCVNDNLCVNFYDVDNNTYTLKVVKYDSDSGTTKKGIYLEYLGNKYLLPDSSMNKRYTVDGVEKEETLCSISDFIINVDDDNKLYSVKIPVYHNGIDLNYDINLDIS